MLDEIATLTGRPLQISYAQQRPGDQVYFVADSGRLAAQTGWHPTIGWRDGLRDLAEWLSADLGLPAVRPRRIKRHGRRMKVALVNPPWRFDGSIYFGCREPHLPLELGYAQALLRQDGHETLLIDCNLGQRTAAEACQDIETFGAEMTVVTTAPTYLFWRCAPPELLVPRAFLQTLGRRGGRTVAVGPHGSVTPAATLRKLDVDAVVRGECEHVVAALANAGDWSAVPSIAIRDR